MNSSRRLIPCLLVALAWSGAVVGTGVADEKAPAAESGFSAAQIEFFEKQVRPILVRRCYECHSGESKEVLGGLRVDSRAALIAGGDTGPAIEPANAEESLLIDAVNHGDIYQMPPDSKLPPAEIAALTRWVELGAPWPAGESATRAVPSAGDQFDLESRREAHWAWRAIVTPEPPAVNDSNWPREELDRFILARLEARQWRPAPRADRRTLIRRLYFDLVGLPPEPAEVEAFLADESPEAYQKLVDRLLGSTQFGERWARHWLDLVRYAESRGHEFDYDAPNAWQYRDYVIRALNADLPYDQFVIEQIAGDLLPDPRRHPTEGYNESILGTGFWFLGEWVHSPVDIHQDEADRHDNMIDVFSKTFLGVTVACARCHDHKFDAISQADYYALAGFLQSSTYRQVRFETMLHNQQIAEQVEALRAESRGPVARAAAESMRPVVERLADYLLAAAECIEQGPLPGAPGDEAVGELVIADFESGSYGDWTTTGDAFGAAPQTLDTIAAYQGKINAQGRYFVNSHNKRDPAARGDEHTGTLTSPKFTVERDFITFLVGGGAHDDKTCVNLLLDGMTVRTATGRNNNQMFPHRWEVADLRGKQVQIEIVDQATGGWGNIGADHFVQTNHASADDRSVAALRRQYQTRCEEVAQKHSLDGDTLLQWAVHLLDPQQRDSSPLAPWMQSMQRPSPAEVSDSLANLASRQSPDLADILSELDVIVDYSTGENRHWQVDGPLMGGGPTTPGAVVLSADANRPIDTIARFGAARRDPFWNGLELAPGTQNDPGRTGSWVRAGRTLATPTFTINNRLLHYLVRGAAKVYVEVDSHRVNQGPLHGALISSFQTEGELRWVSQNVERYQGHRAHVEFSAEGDAPLEIVAVVQADRSPAVPQYNLAAGMATELKQAGAGDRAALAARMQAVFATALARLADQAVSRPLEVALINWALEEQALFELDRPAARQMLATAAESYVEKLRRLSESRKLRSQTAIAMWDGSAVDENLFIRGNHKTPGRVVPRRMLSVLEGEQPRDYGPGSGRLELARQIVSPANPLTSRVIVNRVWHHLFGQGLVRSVDNFGVLGEEPSHAELLDHLAVRLVQEGWSLKRLIRSIVLSSTYQMASGGGDAEAAASDPDNRLLHRQHIRRLEGEAIRDSILAVSGRLEKRPFGPSVPVHLTEFMQGRGRPSSGPLDGEGRRSIYLSVRRNFLSPMMLAFDTPIPFTTVGRRNVSNVPAQALILLNDPLVAEEAARWARRALKAEPESAPARIGLLYRQAFAREATAGEVAAAEAFLASQGAQYNLSPEQAAGDQRVWSDYCHVLINTKEFVFIR